MLKKIVFRSGMIVLLTLLWNHAYAEDYDHKITAKKVTFEWKIENTSLNIQLSASTTGWVGIGFNPGNMMKDANIILAYVKKGKVKAADHFGISDTRHSKDSKLGGGKHISGISGKEENGITTVSFTIPLDSGDPKDKPVKVDGDTKVILACGAGRDSFRSKHSFRTTLDVNLKTGAYK
jgi:hypothetical protein